MLKSLGRMLLIWWAASSAWSEPGGIKAEVRGTLRFEPGHGYFVSVPARGQPTRVWLLVSENKVLVGQLTALTGKPVLVIGSLEQMEEKVRSSVPPLGIYLSSFEIKAGLPDMKK